MSAPDERATRRRILARPALWMGALVALALAVAWAHLLGIAAQDEPRLDHIWLTDGGPPIEGRITSEDAREVQIEISRGRIRIGRDRIERIERGAGSVILDPRDAASTGAATPGGAPGGPAPSGATRSASAPSAATTTADAGIRALSARACELDRAGDADGAEGAARALVLEIRRQLLHGAVTEPLERSRAADAAREALASLPPRPLTVALEEAVGLPVDLLAPAIEHALLLSRAPPAPAVRLDPAPAIALRRAVGEALCHAVRDADALLDPRAVGLVRSLLDEPDEGVRMLVVEHIDGCSKAGVPLVLVDLLEGDPSIEIRARARAALRRISRGVDYGDDAAMWRSHFTTQRVTPP